MSNVAFAPFADSLAGRKKALLAGIGEPVRKYFAYRRTYAQLDALSIDSLLDLDLYRGDLKRLARQAVYGN